MRPRRAEVNAVRYGHGSAVYIRPRNLAKPRETRRDDGTLRLLRVDRRAPLAALSYAEATSWRNRDGREMKRHGNGVSEPSAESVVISLPTFRLLRLPLCLECYNRP